MIKLHAKWRANYLQTDSPLSLNRDELRCTAGIVLKVGDKLTRIGTKRRSWFELKKGVYMVFVGTIDLEGIRHALFSVPAWEEMEGTVNERWYYDFTCVMMDGLVECFLQFTPEGNACRDIDLNEVVYYANPIPVRTFWCNRCGATAVTTDGSAPLCCTQPVEHRTSGICGGEYIEDVKGGR